MPTTTKMGIAYPASTDLVKDGATNMGTIATTVDNKTGLVFIQTNTFTGSAGSSFNSVFSSNFTHYRIMMEVVGSTTAGTLIRMRNAGSDDTSSNYSRYLSTVFFGSGPTRQVATAQSSIDAFQLSAVSNANAIDVINPFATKNTQFNGLANAWNSTSNLEATVFMGHVNTTTSYDGITIYPSSGTFTGTISIYGYNK